MAQRCENCNRTVLDSDTVCWHCGQRLPQREKSLPVKKESAATAVSHLTTMQVRPKRGAAVAVPDVPVSAVGVYGSITAVILIGIFIIMGALSRQPLVVVNANTFIRQGWRPFTDEDTRFTFDHPDSWIILEKQRATQAADFDRMITSDIPFADALLPLSDMAADFEPLVIGISNAPARSANLPAFLVVGQSENLHRWRYDTMIEELAEATPPLHAVIIKTIFNDDRLYLTTEITHDDTVFACQQHVIRLRADVLLVATCNPQQRYTVAPELVNDVLTSFQLLRLNR